MDRASVEGVSMEQLMAKLREIELENQALRDTITMGRNGRESHQPQQTDFAEIAHPEATPALRRTQTQTEVEILKKMEDLKAKYDKLVGKASSDTLDDIESKMIPGLVIPEKFQPPEFQM